jgi:hypothetical protein
MQTKYGSIDVLCLVAHFSDDITAGQAMTTYRTVPAKF